ncbi:MAG TPA: PP2C family protein-serine/threonine phosphatase [Terriglobales bacterium]|nr:PP2C family protein-serine/threonine phosphatase [Terriglobales bacterium]
MYGAMHLSESPAVIAVLPRWLQISAPYAHTAMWYLMAVVASLYFSERSLGKMRFLARVLAFMGLAIAVAAMGFFILTGSNDKLIPIYNLFTACLLLVLMSVVAVPAFSNKYLVLPHRGVLAVGTLVFAIEALYNNLSRALGFKGAPLILDHLAFAVLLFSFGYIALQMVLTNERRLLSIEDELSIAREIQNSILPRGVPELSRLRISTAYSPMTAVAGDFYWFIAVDPNRAGFLVADVSGHGVPAALIASMIKVAMQAVVSCADDPRAVLCGLESALSEQLHDQFVSAAYLWLDTENHKALYSAAGHPPLLRWRQGRLERIQSNGLPFGLIGGRDDYPVCTMPTQSGDRFLLYTDGITEPENTNGDSFGDTRLEQVIRANQGRSPADLSNEILLAIRRWQPPSITQQDDLTLIVIDVV